MRLRSLDGLRGVAALVVVVCHASLTSATLAQVHLQPGYRPDSIGARVLLYTPLHLLLGGTEAVYVFFVLSGFVLALPFLRGGSWRAYYPQRLVRLYVPTSAAVVVAVVAVVVVPRVARPGASWWVNVHAVVLSPGLVLHALAVVKGATWLDSPLWSLRWEVVFSLLLPAYLFAARRANRSTAFVVLLVVTAVGSATRHDMLTYLPMFGVGVLMAFEQDRLRQVAAWLPRAGWWVTVGAGWLLLDAWWTSPQVGAHPWVSGAATGLAVAGAAVTVFVFLGWQPARDAAERPAVQWVGRRSFSLYLVHEPVLISVAMLVHGTLAVLALTVPLSLVAAALFYRAVEAPSQRLAKRLRADQVRPERAQREVERQGAAAVLVHAERHVVASR